MATLVELVNPSDTFGGLRDGYRRAQLGQPNATAGQPPKFRGEVNTPGQNIKAPKILSSAARQNRGSNATIPYARVTPADELCNIGRVAPGDVLFINKNSRSATSAVRMNHAQASQVTTSASIPHARTHRVAGLDYINRALGPRNYQAGHSILVNSYNPADEWRSLGMFNDWVVDGVVLSDDSPGYMLSSGPEARNDRLFNVAIQGPAQLNNGYEDEAGRGIAARHDRGIRAAAGLLHTAAPTRTLGVDSQNRPFTARDSSEIQRMMNANDVKNLVAGPFYDQYPLQMFDRKIRPMTDVFIGLVCKIIDRSTAEDRDLLDSLPDEVFEDYVNPNDGEKGKFKQDGSPNVQHIHVFQYVPFSSRQAWQYAVMQNGDPDPDIVDYSSNGGRKNRDNVGGHEESEPASRRRGPNDPKRQRTDKFLPRDENASYREADNFLGIKETELDHMVGAWRLGRVMDVASSRKEGYMGGPIDTAFRVTLNVDISFLDWRALRRNLFIPWIGLENLNCPNWSYNLRPDGTFVDDEGRLMQWPTEFIIYQQPHTKVTPAEDTNIPIAPFEVERNRVPIVERRGDRMNSNPSSTFGPGGVASSAIFGSQSVDSAAARDAAQQRDAYMLILVSETVMANVPEGLSAAEQEEAVRKGRIQAPAAGGSDGDALKSVSLPDKATLPRGDPVGASMDTAPPAAPPAAPSAAPSAAPLDFPEQIRKPPLAAAAEKGEAPKKPRSRDESSASASKSKETPKESSKRPKSTAVGEDAMADIFGSSAFSAPTERGPLPDAPAQDRPKQFPRRNRDR